MNTLEPIAKIARGKGMEKQKAALIRLPLLANLNDFSTAAVVD